jgi:CRP-like cAMP-binding protein
MDNYNLHEVDIFADLSDDDISYLVSHSKEVDIAKGECFIQEGEPAHTFFVILEGKVDVLKRSPHDNELHRLTQLTKNDITGEMTLLNRNKRIATLTATEHTKVLVFETQAIKGNHKLYEKLTNTLGNLLANRLDFTNEVTVVSMAKQLDEEKKRSALGLYFVRLIYLLSGYSITITLMDKYKDTLGITDSTPLTIAILLVACALMYVIMKKSHISLKTFGITTDNWQFALKDAFWLTVPILFIIILIKWVIISHNPAQHLFQPFISFMKKNEVNYNLYFITLVLYIVFSPLQEFMIRGALQGGLQDLLLGSKIHRVITAIIVSNVIFATLHLHLSLFYVFLTFIMGCYWGYIFARSRSLIGVAMSHVIVGVWAIYIVGIKI